MSHVCERHALPQFGVVQGCTGIGQDVLQGARALSRAHFERCKAEDFSGDAVGDYEPPGWLPNLAAVLPHAGLEKLGLAVVAGRDPKLYATVSVDPHIDEIDGLSVAVVLHADGHRFIQAGASTRLKAGDWFVFDDREPHEVLHTEESTTLVVVTAALLST